MVHSEFRKKKHERKHRPSPSDHLQNEASNRILSTRTQIQVSFFFPVKRVVASPCFLPTPHLVATGRQLKLKQRRINSYNVTIPLTFLQMRTSFFSNLSTAPTHLHKSNLPRSNFPQEPFPARNLSHKLAFFSMARLQHTACISR